VIAMREGQAKVLSQDELKRLYAIAGSGRHAYRDTCLVDFSFKLGLRAKEMSAIMLDDLLDGKANIVESFHLKAEQTKKREGGKGRTVFLTNKIVRKNLQQYLASRDGDNNRHLFKSQKTQFTPNTMQLLFARLYKNAGIVGAKSHSGRRSFCTNLIQNGFDIKSVSVLMGHANIQTTARYIQDNPVQLGKMVAGL
jgi:integrase/recombinase XerD